MADQVMPSSMMAVSAHRDVRLSIITPVFNGARYLAAAIENVVAQRVADVEHVIVDGGSTDGTLEIIRAAAERHPHIRWTSEKDRGQTDAMNKGIALARGEFISFLNADDFYEPHVFSRVTTIIDAAHEPERSALFLLGNTRVIDEDGAVLWINRPGQLRRSWMLTGLSFQRFPINPTAYFYNKHLHERLGGYSMDIQFGHMDLEFVLRALPVARLCYYNEVWGNFRFYRGTITANLAESGEGEKKVMATLRSFHSSLPLHERLLVIPLFAVAGTRAYALLVWLFYRVRFVIRTPRQAIRRAVELVTRSGPPMRRRPW